MSLSIESVLEKLRTSAIPRVYPFAARRWLNGVAQIGALSDRFRERYIYSDVNVSNISKLG